MKLKTFKTKQEIYNFATSLLVERIREKTEAGNYFNLGAATGSTMVNLYQHISKYISNQKDHFKVDFSKINVFNLDEYYPIKKNDKNSYHTYMKENFYKFFPDIPLENRFIQDSTIVKEEVKHHCVEYEKLLIDNPINIQLLGLGRTGHIGFNEPGSTSDTKTRLIDLHSTTREDAKKFFDDKLSKVPEKAMTVGIKSILRAETIILIVTGEAKKEILNKVLNENPNSKIPATYLKNHKDVYCLTEDALISK